MANHGKILAINSYHSHFRGSDGKIANVTLTLKNVTIAT